MLLLELQKPHNILFNSLSEHCNGCFVVLFLVRSKVKSSVSRNINIVQLLEEIELHSQSEINSALLLILLELLEQTLQRSYQFLISSDYFFLSLVIVLMRLQYHLQ